MNVPNKTVRGVGLLVLSLLIFSLQDIAIKWIGGDYPVSETALSVLFLGERVEPRRWLALLVGFVGVLLIARVGAASFNLGSVFVLVSVLFYALSVLMTRRLRSTDSSATMAYYSSLVYVGATAIMAPLTLAVGEVQAHPSVAFLFRAWSMPMLFDWAIMSGLGLVWASGMYLTARAYSLAQAAVVAPFEYATLPINAVWGMLLWREVPMATTWIGALLTVLSGIYIVYREQREQTAPSRGRASSVAVNVREDALR